jgi:hypothetical protein
LTYNLRHEGAFLQGVKAAYLIASAIAAADTNTSTLLRSSTILILASQLATSTYSSSY